MAWAKTTPISILQSSYTHLDFIYVRPAYRKTHALKILLYGLKEFCQHILVANGVLFRDGQRVMQKFINDDSIFRVRVLDKKTGDIAPFEDLVNDPDKCYLFLKTSLPFNQRYLPEPFMESVWLLDLYDT